MEVPQTISDSMFGVPAVGTMAHSWYNFKDEFESFKVYAETYPNDCTLPDTYNVLKSVFKCHKSL